MKRIKTKSVSQFRTNMSHTLKMMKDGEKIHLIKNSEVVAIVTKVGD